MTLFFISLFILATLMRPFEWFVPGLRDYHLLDLIVLGALASAGIEILQRKIKIPYQSPWLFLILGLLAVVLISHASHFYVAGMIESFQDFGKVAIIFTLVIISVKNVKQVQLLILLFILSALLMATHCLMQQHLGRGFSNLAPMIQNTSGWMRTRSFFFGIFGDPNDTALFLVSSLPFIWALFCNPVQKKYWIGIFLCLFVFLAILSTESRSGQMAMVFMAGGYFLLRIPMKKLWAIAPLAFLGLVLSPYLLVKIGWTDDSAMDRFNYWGQANYAFKSSPIFGVGYGMVTDYTYKDASAHNSFVTAYAELGIVGYTVWLALIMFALYSMLRISKMDAESQEDIQIKWIATGLFASLIATCASGFFITRTYYMPLFIALAICAALYGSLASRMGWAPMNDYCGWRAKNSGVAIGASVASIIFIYLFIIVLNKIA